MDFVTLFFIAVGLAMDAFAVAIASGFAISNLRLSNAFTIAFFFGSFQAAMPVVGWLAGAGLRDHISGIDHWIAFSLLGLIGVKMIYESTIIDGAEKDKDPLNIIVLLMLSVATSIDALAVGLSLSFLNVRIFVPALVIGTITFILSFLGVCIGGRFGHFFEKKIEFVGGLVLIAIGAKILFEHLTQ